MKLISAYSEDRVKPKAVARIEAEAEHAETAAAAAAQLTYRLLLEMRTIRWLLIWVLLIIPAAAVVFLLVLGSMVDDTRSSF